MTVFSNTRRLHAQAPATKGFFARLLQIDATYRQRRALARLDDHARRDLGLTGADIAQEAGRAAWDVPAHWRR